LDGFGFSVLLVWEEPLDWIWFFCLGYWIGFHKDIRFSFQDVGSVFIRTFGFLDKDFWIFSLLKNLVGIGFFSGWKSALFPFLADTKMYRFLKLT